jgi:hypothetical protein
MKCHSISSGSCKPKRKINKLENKNESSLTFIKFLSNNQSYCKLIVFYGINKEENYFLKFSQGKSPIISPAKDHSSMTAITFWFCSLDEETMMVRIT